MKILFHIGSMSKGGAERVIANLSNYLSQDNDIYIVTSINKEPEYTLKKNVKLYFLNDEKIGSMKRLKRIIYRRKKLKEIIKEVNPDITIAFLPEPIFMVISLRKSIKCPIIVSERNDPRILYKSFLYYILMKIYYKKADGFVFQTKEAKEYFSKKIQEKSVIIKNPLNDEFLTTNKNIQKKDIIISTGRLSEQKNQKMLINAFAKITDKYPNYKLIIYGEGILRKKLEEQVKNLKLENKVFLPGVVDNIKEKIEECKIFVLPSNYEGMPNALMEAMALGLPVISTDCPCGGPRELIKNDYNGILIPVNAQEELERKLEELIGNSEKAKNLGKHATEIKNDTNIDVIANKWKEYIECLS